MLVLDANIPIRVLGRRVRAMIATYGNTVEFFAPDVAFAEAREHLPTVLVKRRENVTSRLHNCYSDSAKRNLVFTAKLLALLDAFETEGIAVVPLKGPVLAESLYPDPVLRPFSDLDLLVRKQDVPAALRLLTREGYTLGPHLARLPWHTLLSLQFELLFRQGRLSAVDLQWETALAPWADTNS